MSKTLRVANGDWYIDSRGRPAYIEEREKAAQDTACVLLQKLYADGSWGSELHRVEEGTIVDTINAHKALIQTLVSEAVERLMALQEQEEDIPDLEKIASYVVTVQRQVGRSLSYAYYLEIDTEGSDEPVTQTYVVEIEQVRDPDLINADPYGDSNG